MVEAVTGTGKTIVGVAAAIAELGCGGQVLVLVPTRELADQWTRVLARHVPATAHIGRLGDGHRDDLGHHDIVVAVVNSARDADLRPRRPGGLLVADECHRYGSDANRVALGAPFPDASVSPPPTPAPTTPISRGSIRTSAGPATGSVTSAPSATASSPPSSSRCAASS